MQRYTHISIEERFEIARLYREGTSIRKIAAALDRSPSSVSREIKRNSNTNGQFQPAYADQKSLARRWSGSRLERNRDLREAVLMRLSKGWSPEQIAGRFAKDTGRCVISHESIYRFIYAQMARTKDYRWRHYLPQAKSKRGRIRRGGGSSVAFITHRKSLKDRPGEVNNRETPGHWEADYMLFSTYGQSVLALHERRSRLLMASRQPSREAKPTAAAMKAILAPIPSAWRQTVTFDNGTEFVRHHDLHDINVKTYFCEPRKPWQKGGVENAIGRLRRKLPRTTDLDKLPDDHFENVIRSYNNTPRKCLNYQTPAEIFYNEVLHFKCECTSPPSRG